MPTEQEYRKVADVVAHLITMTDRDRIIWLDHGPLGFSDTTYREVRYMFWNPQDGKPSLAVDDVDVWEGYELWSLRDSIHRQDFRIRPSPPPPPPPEPDARIPAALNKALKTLRKK